MHPRSSPLRRLAPTLAASLALSVLASAQTIDGEVVLDAGQSGAGGTASGLATYSYDTATGVFSIDVSATGLTGAGTACHLHDVQTDAILVPLTSAGVNAWSFSGSVSGEDLFDLFHEQWYVNVHSTGFPAGEVRGTVILATHFRGELSGANEVPPVASAAKGRADLVLNQPAGTLTYVVTASGLTGPTTGAHIHLGGIGVGPGAILLPLTQTGPTTWSGTTPALAVDDMIDLHTAGWYVNVHSTGFPAGEVRDQIWTGFLNANSDVYSVGGGGTISLLLDAGPQYGGMIFWVLGSFSGTSPGLTSGGFTLPLNPDLWLIYTLQNPNLFPYTNSANFLDANGRARTDWMINPNQVPELVGLTLNHAYAILDLGFNGLQTSNAKAWTFIP